MSTPCCAARWRPAAAPCSRPSGSTRAQRLHLRASSSSSSSASSVRAALTAAEQELVSAVGSLGFPQAIFPGEEATRASIDATIARLEAATPTPSPLQPVSPLLLGNWVLIYASSGTYVTRTKGAQALLAASALPGVGVSDVRQGLALADSSSSESSSSGGGGIPAASNSSSGSGSSGSSSRLRTSNAALLGLGPFGEWEVEIGGSWDARDGQLARVRFDGFSLQLVGVLGLLKLPRMAKVSVPIPNGRSVDFATTYLSDGLRVARGSTGNLFLFGRAPAGQAGG